MSNRNRLLTPAEVSRDLIAEVKRFRKKHGDAATEAALARLQGTLGRFPDDELAKVASYEIEPGSTSFSTRPPKTERKP